MPFVVPFPLVAFLQIRSDWPDIKLAVMYAALRRKFTSYPDLQDLLLSTGSSLLVEASVKDPFWGEGRTGRGANYLGRLLMRLRQELAAERKQGVRQLSSSQTR